MGLIVRLPYRSKHEQESKYNDIDGDCCLIVLNLPGSFVEARYGYDARYYKIEPSIVRIVKGRQPALRDHLEEIERDCPNEWNQEFMKDQARIGQTILFLSLRIRQKPWHSLYHHNPPRPHSCASAHLRCHLLNLVGLGSPNSD
jgi:hypothetical protein